MEGGGGSRQEERHKTGGLGGGGDLEGRQTRAAAHIGHLPVRTRACTKKRPRGRTQRVTHVIRVL